MLRQVYRNHHRILQKQIQQIYFAISEENASLKMGNPASLTRSQKQTITTQFGTYVLQSMKINQKFRNKNA